MFKVVLISSTCASDYCLTINARFSFISDKMLVYGLMIARFFNFEIKVNLTNLSVAETKTHKLYWNFAFYILTFMKPFCLL